MSRFWERYLAWRELHREPAMHYRAICQRYMPPIQIAALDRILKDVHAIKLYCHWWNELKTVAPHEAQIVCSIDHDDVWERFNGHCVCCGLVMTKPPAKAPEPSPKPMLQLAFEV